MTSSAIPWSWSTSVSIGCAIWHSRSRCSRWSRPGWHVSFPPLRSLDALPGNLPVQHSSFVGRERRGRRGRRVAARGADRDADRRGWRGQDPSGVPGRSGARAASSVTVRGWWSWPGYATRACVVDAVAAVFGVPPRPGVPILDDAGRRSAAEASCCWCSTTASTSWARSSSWCATLEDALPGAGGALDEPRRPGHRGRAHRGRAVAGVATLAATANAC